MTEYDLATAHADGRHVSSNPADRMFWRNAGCQDCLEQYDERGLPLQCLDVREGNPCAGKVEYRMPLSATGRPFPRCDRHWKKRLDVQRGIDRRYPDSPTPPPGFDPAYAGESWDGE